MNNQEFKDFLRVAYSMSHCPKCGKKYNGKDILIKGSRKNEFLVQFHCCRPIVATVSLSRKSPKAIFPEFKEPFEEEEDKLWKKH